MLIPPKPLGDGRPGSPVTMVTGDNGKVQFHLVVRTYYQNCRVEFHLTVPVSTKEIAVESAKRAWNVREACRDVIDSLETPPMDTEVVPDIDCRTHAAVDDGYSIDVIDGHLVVSGSAANIETCAHAIPRMIDEYLQTI